MYLNLLHFTSTGRQGIQTRIIRIQRQFSSDVQHSGDAGLCAEVQGSDRQLPARDGDGLCQGGVHALHHHGGQRL